MCKASLSEGGLILGGVATSSTRVCVDVNILSEFVASMYIFNTTEILIPKAIDRLK
jgi:hypothetical protein